jgi:hypothetical protein
MRYHTFRAFRADNGVFSGVTTVLRHEVPSTLFICTSCQTTALVDFEAAIKRAYRNETVGLIGFLVVVTYAILTSLAARFEILLLPPIYFLLMIISYWVFSSLSLGYYHASRRRYRKLQEIRDTSPFLCFIDLKRPFLIHVRNGEFKDLFARSNPDFKVIRKEVFPNLQRFQKYIDGPSLAISCCGAPFILVFILYLVGLLYTIL